MAHTLVKFLNLLLIPLCLLALADGPIAQAQSQGFVKKIYVEGQRKIEEAAIREKLVSKEGRPYLRENVSEDVKLLFATGFFYDIKVDEREVSGGVNLIYTVVEKPSLVDITYEGNDELSDEELAESTGLKPFEVLSYSKLNVAVEKIQKLYEDKGFFLAQVKYRVIDQKKNETVRVKFVIQENDMVKVKKITIIGNKKLSDGKIKSVLATQEGGFFSFLSGSGAYRQDAFDRDMQIINFLYFNEGFIQVKIDRPQVYVSPDKKSIYITIRLEEGDQFDVGEIGFGGDVIFPEEELVQAIKTKEDTLFSYQTLQGDLQTLTAKYGDLGYAFANVIPRTRTRTDGDKKLVDITFEVDKGSKVYIGRISVIGNSKTRDKVVRRELMIHEGELYHETRKRQSLANVKRLGFFEEVNFNTSSPSGDQNRIDIEIVVKERNTGTIQVGAGFSSFQGFIFNGQVNQINLFGRGQRLGATVDVGNLRSLYNVNFTEPFFLDTQWELGFDAYQSQRVLLDFTEAKTGGAVRVGHPFSPYLRGIVRYKLDDTQLNLDDDGDPEIFPTETATGLTSSITLSLIYDKRDDRFAPTKGIFTSLSLEYAGLGGDLNYTKGLAWFRYYKTLFWKLVWRNNINYGFVTANDNDPPPFNELFLLGGANTLRGFEWFTIGRRKKSDQEFSRSIADGNSAEQAEIDALRPFGGTQQFYYQMELQFPLISEAGILGVVFYDIGNADNVLRLEDFRSDAGFGFRWFSPIGPLRFEWGFPFNRRSEFDELPVNFQFAIGSPF